MAKGIPANNGGLHKPSAMVANQIPLPNTLSQWGKTAGTAQSSVKATNGGLHASTNQVAGQIPLPPNLYSYNPPTK